MRATSFAEKLEKHSIPEPNSGCMLWTGGGLFHGYGIVSHRRNGACETTQAHRLSWRVHRGPIPSGMQVCHKCDVRACVNPDHLFLGTATENMQDMWGKGRSGIHKRRGEKHKGSKLSDVDALYIRASDEKGTDLARRFGVSRALISLVKNGHSRGYLEQGNG